jgi:hypothetical protein
MPVNVALFDGSLRVRSPREMQIARELEIRGGLNELQLVCHERSGGMHYLTAPQYPVGEIGSPFRCCIQCSARLPPDYLMPA